MRVHPKIAGLEKDQGPGSCFGGRHADGHSHGALGCTGRESLWLHRLLWSLWHRWRSRSRSCSLLMLCPGSSRLCNCLKGLDNIGYRVFDIWAPETRWAAAALRKADSDSYPSTGRSCQQAPVDLASSHHHCFFDRQYLHIHEHDFRFVGLLPDFVALVARRSVSIPPVFHLASTWSHDSEIGFGCHSIWCWKVSDEDQSWPRWQRGCRQLSCCWRRLSCWRSLYCWQDWLEAMACHEVALPEPDAGHVPHVHSNDCPAWYSSSWCHSRASCWGWRWRCPLRHSSWSLGWDHWYYLPFQFIDDNGSSISELDGSKRMKDTAGGMRLWNWYCLMDWTL